MAQAGATLISLGMNPGRGGNRQEERLYAVQMDMQEGEEFT